MRKLIRDCWQNDPSKRPTFGEIRVRMGGVIIGEVLVYDEPDFTIVDEYEEEEEEEANLDVRNANNNRLNRNDPVDALKAEIRALKKLNLQYKEEIARNQSSKKSGVEKGTVAMLTNASVALPAKSEDTYAI